MIIGIRNQTLRVCITYRCNASCKVCYSRGLNQEFPYDMSLEDFNYMVNWAKKLSWTKFMFLGGEPTIHPHFKDFLEICYNKEIGITLSTNGLFTDNILKAIRPSYVTICLDYLEGQIQNPNYKKIFFRNLEYLKKRKVFIVLSGLIDGVSERWKETIEIAKNFNLHIKWSLRLPGYGNNHLHTEEFFKPEAFGRQLLQILELSKEKQVFSFVYRPVLLCMFTPEQLKELTKLNKYLFFTRCVLGFRGDYTLALTVNPDLSIYPCNNFYLKGPSIRNFKDRASINRYLKEVVDPVLMSPSSEKCKDCAFFLRFKATLKERKLLLKENLFSE
ncbi:MAG: radical SAM protein, partial [Candidatus Omnitrophica bacterium]|nr:radical SAM protein [Candidatus Omnitrophota bacterium]